MGCSTATLIHTCAQVDTCISLDTRCLMQHGNEILYVLQSSDCYSLLKLPNLRDNTRAVFSLRMPHNNKRKTTRGMIAPELMHSAKS